jgi:hypothetical protein
MTAGILPQPHNHWSRLFLHITAKRADQSLDAISPIRRSQVAHAS